MGEDRAGTGERNPRPRASTGQTPEDAAPMTIDALAQRTGMSARNIRAHQSRGLLAPPRLRGRTGYYSQEHVARIELIQMLQSDGFSLALIERLLRLEELGLLRLLRDGPVEQLTPMVFRGGEVFADLGVPAEDIVAVAAELRKQLDGVASTCLRLLIDSVWRPSEAAGQQDKGMDKLLDAVERLRPLASAAVGSLFQVAMSDALERRFGSEVGRLESHRRA